MIAEQFFKMNYFLQGAFSMRNKTNYSQIQITFSKQQDKVNNIAIKSEILFLFQRGIHYFFMSKWAFIFKAVPGMKTKQRFSLGLLRTLHFAWNCFYHNFSILLRKPNQLLIASPVLVCDSKLKQAPAILVALHGNRWGSLLWKTISCCYRVFLLFSPLLSHPICVLIFLPLVTRLKTSLSLSEKRACTVPLLCLTSLHLHQGWGIPQCLF